MMNKYSSYKDSEIEWLDQIPSNWIRSRIRMVGDLYGGLSGKKGDDFNNEDNPSNKPFVPFTNIFNNTYISNDHFQYVNIEEGENQNRVLKNDLFFLMSSESYEDLGKSSILLEDVEELYLNSFCKGYRIKDKRVYPLFLNYQLLGSLHKEMISIEGNGFTRINLRQDRLLDIPVFIPPFPEQQHIVSYLDRKTQKIDDLIKHKKSKIELLKEKRTSLINQVVTKGLDPNVEMKDSGVEWIGEIPSHWNYIPTKYFTEDEKGVQTGPFGTQLNTKDYVESGVKVMNQKTLIDEDYGIGEEFISHEKFKGLKVFVVIEGDIIMGTRGSFGTGKRTTFGKVSIVPKGLGDCVLHPCLIRVRLKEDMMIKPYYYIYINESSYFLDDVRNTSNSTTIEVIYGITLKDIKVPVPPILEQQQIVEYLNRHTQEIDKLIQLEQEKIHLLKEYRQSLISEVVTGKKRVCKEDVSIFSKN